MELLIQQQEELRNMFNLMIKNLLKEYLKEVIEMQNLCFYKSNILNFNNFTWIFFEIYLCMFEIDFFIK